LAAHEPMRRASEGRIVSPFAEALRDLRFSRGVRQQELADMVGCERSYVSALENDVKNLAAWKAAL